MIFPLKNSMIFSMIIFVFSNFLVFFNSKLAKIQNQLGKFHNHDEIQRTSTKNTRIMFKLINKSWIASISAWKIKILASKIEFRIENRVSD